MLSIYSVFLVWSGGDVFVFFKIYIISFNFPEYISKNNVLACKVDVTIVILQMRHYNLKSLMTFQSI